MVIISNDIRDLSPEERIKRLRDLEEAKKKEFAELKRRKKKEVNEAEKLIKKTIEELREEEEKKFLEQEEIIRKKLGSIEELVEQQKLNIVQQVQYGGPIETLKQEYNQTKELYERIINEGITDNNIESFYRLKEQIKELGQDQYSRQKDINNYITRSEDVLKMLEKKIRLR
ncbi:MAG: hypothetical protein QXG00_06010 [Candidatus Woesearchaeota archaeon]